MIKTRYFVVGAALPLAFTAWSVLNSPCSMRTAEPSASQKTAARSGELAAPKRVVKAPHKVDEVQRALHRQTQVPWVGAYEAVARLQGDAPNTIYMRPEAPAQQLIKLSSDLYIDVSQGRTLTLDTHDRTLLAALGGRDDREERAMAPMVMRPSVSAVDGQRMMLWSHSTASLPFGKDAKVKVEVAHVDGAILALYSSDERDRGGVLYKLDARSGEVLWRINFADVDPSWPWQSAGLIVDGSALHVQAHEGQRAYVLELALEDGALLRRREVPWALAKPQRPLRDVQSPHVFSVTPQHPSGVLLKYDAWVVSVPSAQMKPKPRWTLALAHPQVSPALEDGATLNFVSFDPGRGKPIFYRLDRASGELIWAKRLGLGFEGMQVRVGKDAAHGWIVAEVSSPSGRYQEIFEPDSGQLLAKTLYEE